MGAISVGELLVSIGIDKNDARQAIASLSKLEESFKKVAAAGNTNVSVVKKAIASLAKESSDASKKIQQEEERMWKARDAAAKQSLKEREKVLAQENRMWSQHKRERERELNDLAKLHKQKLDQQERDLTKYFSKQRKQFPLPYRDVETADPRNKSRFAAFSKSSSAIEAGAAAQRAQEAMQKDMLRKAKSAFAAEQLAYQNMLQERSRIAAKKRKEAEEKAKAIEEKANAESLRRARKLHQDILKSKMAQIAAEKRAQEFSTVSQRQSSRERFNRIASKYGDPLAGAASTVSGRPMAGGRAGAGVSGAASARKQSEAMRELGSAATIALGPLSGVASRIIAINGLANRQTAIFAGVVAGLIGYTGVLVKLIKHSAELERRFLRLDTQLKTVAERFGLTVEKVDEMAFSLAKTTLDSTDQARDAYSTLLSTTGLLPHQLERAATAASDIGAAIGTDVSDGAKKLAKALEDPVNGLEGLQRSMITFTKEEKKLIEMWTNSGNAAQAFELILERVNAKFGGLAAGQPKGLIGSLDTAGESWNHFLDSIVKSKGLFSTLVPQVDRLSSTFQRWATEVEQGRGIFHSLKEAIEFAMPSFQTLGDVLAGVASRMKEILTVTAAGIAIYSMVGIFGKVGKAAKAAEGSMGKVGKGVKEFITNTMAGKVATAAAIVELLEWLDVFNDVGESSSNAAKSLEEYRSQAAQIKGLRVGLVFAVTDQEKKTISDQIYAIEQDILKSSQGTSLAPGARSILVKALTANLTKEDFASPIRNIVSFATTTQQSLGIVDKSYERTVTSVTQAIQNLTKIHEITQQPGGTLVSGLLIDLKNIEEFLRANDPIEKATESYRRLFYEVTKNTPKLQELEKSLIKAALAGKPSVWMRIAEEMGMVGATIDDVVNKLHALGIAAKGSPRDFGELMTFFKEDFRGALEYSLSSVSQITSQLASASSSYLQLKSQESAKRKEAISTQMETVKWLKAEGIISAELAGTQMVNLIKAREQATREEKKAFEINKKMQLASAIINTASGVAGALGSQPWGPWNIGLASAVAAAGAAQVALISSTSFNGGASGMSLNLPSAGGMGTDFISDVNQDQATRNAQAAGGVTNVYNINALDTKSFSDALMEQSVTIATANRAGNAEMGIA